MFVDVRLQRCAVTSVEAEEWCKQVTCSFVSLDKTGMQNNGSRWAAGGSQHCFMTLLCALQFTTDVGACVSTARTRFAAQE